MLFQNTSLIFIVGTENSTFMFWIILNECPFLLKYYLVFYSLGHSEPHWILFYSIYI